MGNTAKFKTSCIKPQWIATRKERHFDELFTEVPMGDIVELLKEKFFVDIVNLFDHRLASIYFVWRETFYENRGSVVMGSPLSLIFANSIKESFEQGVLRTATYQPKH